MNQLIDSLSKNPWLIVIASLVTLISFLLSIYFFYASRKIKRPSYSVKSFTIVSESMGQKAKDLEITYKNKFVKNLTITRVLFINRGNEVINSNDIAPKEPLKIIFPSELNIFNFKILYIKEKANNISLTLDNNQVLLNFDYLSYNEGFIFQIVHSGVHEEMQIRGIVKGINQLYKFEIEDIVATEALIYIAFSGIMTVFVANIIIVFITIISGESNFGDYLSIFTIQLIFVFMFLVISLLLHKQKRIPKDYVSIFSKNWKI